MKGFYSIMVGVIVLFVLASAVFTVNSFNKSQALIPQKEAFAYTIKEWQNTRRMLDKATSDAIIDSAFSASCLTGTFNPDTNIIRYDQNLLELTNRDCQIKNIETGITIQNIIANQSHSIGERNVYDVNVRMDLICSKKIKIGLDLNSLVSYDKNILFEKRVDANYSSPPYNDCNIFVMDLQSGLKDINYFING